MFIKVLTMLPTRWQIVVLKWMLRTAEKISDAQRSDGEYHLSTELDSARVSFTRKIRELEERR